MPISLVLHFLFGLLITSLFCAAAGVAARRAPRQLLWLSLVAAGHFFMSVSGGISMIYVSRLQGGRSATAFSSLIFIQSALSAVSYILLFAGALSLLLFLLNERQNVPGTVERQNR